ncbi:MAG: FG-GAP repeat protein, partial [Gemmatimonadaceae bacterium]|nr:FG-GAP repeat protein [Gloeobacterales cyanobacterium ES-bin-141]
VDGVSNTLAAALWATDMMFEAANVGAGGVNIISGSQPNMTPMYFDGHIDYKGKATYTPQVYPLYYGMLLFAQATANGASLVPVTSEKTGNMKVWATRDNQGTVRVVALNKDQSLSGNVRIYLPGLSNNGTLVRLSASSVSAKTGLTLAGQTFDGTTDGKALGTYTSTPVTASDSTYVFSLPAGSAAMLTLEHVPGDFNTDGKPDILWRHQTTGQNTVWLMDGTTLTSNSSLPVVGDTNWQVAGSEDFNMDGKPDILWRHQTTGQNTVWLMDGTSLASTASLPTISNLQWHVGATGDFNTDGKPDILWRNQTTGQNTVWLMNGTTLTTSVPLQAVTDTNWQVTGSGDFNKDGKPDILWRHLTTGRNSAWLMNGTTFTASANLPTVADLNWQVGGVADINTDGKPDILWRNQTTGRNSAWLMNGTALATSATLSAEADLAWKMRGPR